MCASQARVLECSQYMAELCGAEKEGDDCCPLIFPLRLGRAKGEILQGGCAAVHLFLRANLEMKF